MEWRVDSSGLTPGGWWVSACSFLRKWKVFVLKKYSELHKNPPDPPDPPDIIMHTQLLKNISTLSQIMCTLSPIYGLKSIYVIKQVVFSWKNTCSINNQLFRIEGKLYWIIFNFQMVLLLIVSQNQVQFSGVWCEFLQPMWCGYVWGLETKF